MEQAAVIRAADPAEHQLLTVISFRSKSYWAYPEEYFQIWNDELTITPSYIQQNEVFVCELEEKVVGYYALVELTEALVFSGVELEAGLWLDHMFIRPESIGTGLGQTLFLHCRSRLSKREATRLNILADPNALGFYLKMGCVYCGDYPSSIPGRTTPRLIYVPDGDNLSQKED